MKRQKRLIIWAAKGMFKSAYKLKVALQAEIQRKVLVVRSNSPRFKARFSDVIINWGNSRWPNFRLAECINDPDSVAIAVNKLCTFQALSGKCNTPEWTTDPDVAHEWWTEGKEFVARYLLSYYGGKGITLFNKETRSPLTLPYAPLYVQYKKKKKEFRVHVFKGEVIDVTQKKKRKDFEGEVNTKIRNYANGWVYCREDIEEPDDLRLQATLAVGALELDFGAVDCIFNEKENKTYILEINSAPGMEGQTIEAYKNAILDQINPWVPANEERRNDQF